MMVSKTGACIVLDCCEKTVEKLSRDGLLTPKPKPKGRGVQFELAEVQALAKARREARNGR